jgi:hypothetical protein
MSEELFTNFLREAVTMAVNEETATTSRSVGEIAGALSKSQGAMSGAFKDKSNPFFKSKYADLEAIWGVAREPLAANDLSVVQYVSKDNKTMVTHICHKSGEWMKGYWPFTPSKQDAQGMGSAGSYARRYGLASMLGIFQTDDDGNAACVNANKEQSSPASCKSNKSSSKPKISTPQAKNNSDDLPIEMAKEVFGGEEVPLISEERIAKLREMISGKTTEEKLCEEMKVKRIENLESTQYTKAITQIRRLAKEGA